MISTATKGRTGEAVACRYLADNGYEIITRNFRCQWGEIDIIGAMGDNVVFFEVKNWQHYSWQDIEFSINKDKQRRLVNAAHCFLSEHSEFNESFKRFDVLFLSNNIVVRHIQDAFSEQNHD